MFLHSNVNRLDAQAKCTIEKPGASPNDQLTENSSAKPGKFWSSVACQNFHLASRCLP